ncbi:MAG: carbon monoxide dehydrogenase subunit G [Pseudomonadota bacterium]
MKLAGRYRIAADRETVWKGLNDPEILEKSIPGCKELTQNSPTELAATVVAKFGPVKATFAGEVVLENLNPPASYTLRGEGKGGVAGFGKGSADVSLEEIEHEGAPATILSYDADAQIGGKLAQIGSRLVGGAVKRMASDFFTAFAAALDAEAEELPIDDAEETA